MVQVTCGAAITPCTMSKGSFDFASSPPGKRGRAERGFDRVASATDGRRTGGGRVALSS